MSSVRSPKPQLSMVLPSGLKNILKKASENLECSQAEVVRSALYDYFKDLSLLSEEMKKDQS